MTGWKMTIDERKRLLALIFEEVTADAEGLVTLRAREDWKPYMRAVVPAAGGSERKTGLKERGVATVRLAQDERGWLRLAS